MLFSGLFWSSLNYTDLEAGWRPSGNHRPQEKMCSPQKGGEWLMEVAGSHAVKMVAKGYTTQWQKTSL